MPWVDFTLHPQKIIHFLAWDQFWFKGTHISIITSSFVSHKNNKIKLYSTNNKRPSKTKTLPIHLGQLYCENLSIRLQLTHFHSPFLQHLIASFSSSLLSPGLAFFSPSKTFYSTDPPPPSPPSFFSIIFHVFLITLSSLLTTTYPLNCIEQHFFYVKEISKKYGEKFLEERGGGAVIKKFIITRSFNIFACLSRNIPVRRIQSS